jgi:DNA-binding transcriptional MerR regulator
MAMPETSLSIGEVINLLREDFPDVSVSKVRFLESQGLLAPGRSEGGYRQFDEHDLERLRFILRQQRDHFLPLKVIKSKLTLWERGEEQDGGGEGPIRELLDEEATLTRSELLRRSGINGPQLDSLIEHGLIRATGDLFIGDALVVATESRRLFQLGLEPRHLRTIRHAAERQADVLAQLTAGLLRARNTEAREQARNVLSGAGEAVIAMHRALFAEELRSLLEQ